MTLPSFSLDRSPVSLLNKAFTLAAILVALACAASGLQVATATMARNDAQAAIGDRKQALADALTREKNKDKAVFAGELVGLKPSGTFQKKLRQIAQRNGCRVAQYDAASVLKPLLSEATGPNASKGWMQIDVAVTLNGPSQSIVNTLRDLAEGDAAFQILTIDLNRTKLSAVGQGECSALVNLALVTRQGAA